MDQKTLILMSIILGIIIVTALAARFFTNWINAIQKTPSCADTLRPIGYTGASVIELTFLVFVAVLWIVLSQ